MNRSREEWELLLKEAPPEVVMINPGREFESSQFLRFILESWGLEFRQTDVVDIGCAWGRLALAFEDEFSSYVGLDVNLPTIRFAKQLFQHKDTVRFVHHDVYNWRYNPQGKLDPFKASLPLNDKTADIVVGWSVFSHIQYLEAARNYLSEIRRISRHEGRIILTWFRDPPNKESNRAERTVMKEAQIINCYSQLGLEIIHTDMGLSTEYNDQWQILAVNAR